MWVCVLLAALVVVVEWACGWVVGMERPLARAVRRGAAPAVARPGVVISTWELGLESSLFGHRMLV